MKTLIAACLSLVALTADAEDEALTVTWQDIGGSVQIVGRLGVPFGTVVKIEATLLSGTGSPNARRDHRLSVLRYLRVEAINGVPSEETPLMVFEERNGPWPTTVAEPGGSRGIPAPPVPLAEVELGTTVTLYAFEWAQTPGNPTTGPEDAGFQFIAMAAEPDKRANPHFRSRLLVVQPCDAEDNKAPAGDALKPH